MCILNACWLECIRPGHNREKNLKALSYTSLVPQMSAFQHMSNHQNWPRFGEVARQKTVDDFRDIGICQEFANSNNGK